MKIGDIVEYQKERETETGTVIEIHENTVKVTFPDRPESTQTVSKNRIVNIKNK